MERTASTASLRRKRSSSKKLLRYSAQALSQFILLATTIFIALALIGGSVQVYRFVQRSNGPSLTWFTAKKAATTTPPGEESLSSLAISTTLTALSLWGKFILSVLIPATDHSLVFAKEGWTTLEPSLRQSTLWFVYETSAAFKLGVFSFLVFVFCIWLLERELKRRRIAERVSAQLSRINQRAKLVSTYLHGKYVLVREEVARESRIAAMLLPHLLYAVFCVCAYLFVGEHLAPLSRGFSAWFVTVGVPVAFSAQKLLKYDEVCRERLKTQNPDDANLSSADEEEEEEDESEEEDNAATPKSRLLPATPRSEFMESALQNVRRRLLSDASLTSPSHDTYGLLNADTVHDFDPVLDWLRYWTVLSVCLLWEQFPLTGHFLAVIPVWPEIRLAFALWLQLPITRGCDWAFMVIVPFLDRYVKKLPLITNKATGLLQQTEQQRGIVVTLLSSVGLVSKKTGKKMLKATEANGNLLLISIPFLLSPTFVTKVGVLVVGLAFPAQASTTCILEIEHFKQELADRKKHDGGARMVEEEETHTSGEASVFWLEYWIVYVLFSLAHGALATMFGWWFPLWDQMHLLFLLWMQITYFSGAHHVFNLAVVVSRVYRRRRRAMARALLASRRRTIRENSVATPQEKMQGLAVSILPSSLLPRLSIHLEEGAVLISSDSEEEEEEGQAEIVEEEVAASKEVRSASVSTARKESVASARKNSVASARKNSVSSARKNSVASTSHADTASEDVAELEAAAAEQEVE